uniref:Uncharacterized protein n=1 Tax=Romanomermis culicivorax TaxID=13658 RepID=A0A915K0C5_ROMCU
MGSEIDLAIESILSKDVDLSSASDLGTISKNSTFDDVVMGFHNHHHHTSLETDQDFSFFHHNTQNACRSLDFQRQTAQSHKFLYSDNVAKNPASFLPLSGNSSDFESNFMTSSSHISLTSMDSTTSNAVASATQILPPLFNSTTIEGGSVTAADDFFAMDICSQTYPLLSSAAITLGDDSPVKNTQADVAVNLQRRPLPPAAPPAKNAGQQIDNLLVEFINLNFIDEAIL